jgi:hypothetical protein
MKNDRWRWPWQKEIPEPVRPPKVGGTRAPDSIREIDFKKPHDFHFCLGQNGNVPIVLQRCLLVGFTTPLNDETGDEPNFLEYPHTRWLVLQHEDGHLIYVPRDQLIYIEESRRGD